MASKEQVQAALDQLWEKYGNTLNMLSDSLEKIESQEQRIQQLESELNIEPDLDLDLSTPEGIKQLEKSVLNVPLPISAILSEPFVSLSKLIQFKEGDIMNLPPVDGVDFFVDDKLLFKADIGETNGQVAVSLKNRL